MNMVFLRHIAVGFLLLNFLLLVSCSKKEDDSEIFTFEQNCPIIEIIDSISDSPYVKYVSFRYENNICTGYDYRLCYADTQLYSYNFFYSNDLLTTIKVFNLTDLARKQWDSSIINVNRINNDEIIIHSTSYGEKGVSASDFQFSGNRIVGSDHIMYLDKSQNIVKEEFFSGGNAIPYITRLYVYDQKPSPLYNLPFIAKIIGMHNMLGFPGSSGFTNNIIQCTHIIEGKKTVYNFNLEYNDNEYPVNNNSKFGALTYYYGSCY
jgi:hypothetical protein